MRAALLASFVAGASAKIKCDGALPLANFNGFDMYCGVGAPPCPAGSYCDVSADLKGRYAVCCPGLIPTVVTTPVVTPVITIPVVSTVATVANKCINGPPISILGIDLYCGSGFGGVDCPMGSQCTSDVLGTWAVCCPLAATTTATVVVTVP